MRRVFWLVAAALLLAGCAGEKGIVEKEGYQLDTQTPGAGGVSAH